MDKATLILALTLAAGLRVAAIALAVVFLLGWLVVRVVGSLWMWILA